jgi:hypothetical protein
MDSSGDPNCESDSDCDDTQLSPSTEIEPELVELHAKIKRSASIPLNPHFEPLARDVPFRKLILKLPAHFIDHPPDPVHFFQLFFTN